MASKTLLVAQREYLENVRTKTFWLGILAFPAIFALAIGIGWIMQKTKAQQVYAVLDLTADGLGQRIEADARANDFLSSLRRFAREQGLTDDDPQLRQLESVEMTAAEAELAKTAIPTELQQRLAAVLDSVAARYRLVTLAEIGADQGPREAQEKRLGELVRSGRLFAYFVLEGDPVAAADGLSYVSNNLTDEALRSWYAEAATRVIRKARVTAAGIAPATARHIQERIDWKAQQVTATGVEDVKQEQKANKFAPVVFVYLLWVAVFTAAQMLLTNTVEEKSNRIIEVLLSSVSPGQLMAGKIWGIGATGLTLILSWAACGLIGVNIGAQRRRPALPGLVHRLLPHRLPAVRGGAGGDRFGLQQPEGGAESAAAGVPAADDPAVRDGAGGAGTEWRHGARVHLHPALHAVRDDEPRQRAAAGLGVRGHDRADPVQRVVRVPRRRQGVPHRRADDRQPAEAEGDPGLAARAVNAPAGRGRDLRATHAPQRPAGWFRAT